MDQDEPLSIYTIYFNPTDYPGRYVTRRYDVYPDRTEAGSAVITDSLEAARAYLPEWLHKLSPMDPPPIVEVWV